MNHIAATPKPCRTAKEWLRHHAATICPRGYALGLSALERQTGIIATTQSWIERAKQQAANEVRAVEQKRLHSRKKSRK